MTLLPLPTDWEKELRTADSRRALGLLPGCAKTRALAPAAKVGCFPKENSIPVARQRNGQQQSGRADGKEGAQ